ncbi:MAG: hypothetical protein R3181_13215, partial [Rubricoccaceae bacterium]|nr:hypothetical protein [Rubricoccaceae bacterium]
MPRSLLALAAALLVALPVGAQTLDGDLSDPEYQTLATKLNANGDFGPDIDVTEIVYFADATNGVLYLGLKGKLNTGSSDGISVWLDFSELSGAPAGTALGGIPNTPFSYYGAANGAFTADFEVDYSLVVNPGAREDSVFVDAASYVGIPDTDFLGRADQAGTAALGPPDATTNNGNASFFSVNSVGFAFDNSGAADTGFEVAIPFSELGITGTGDLSAFAFVVSSSAYFSNVTVPGDVTAGNLGFDPDFNANLTSGDCACPNPSSPIGTGPYHATVSLGGGVSCEAKFTSADLAYDAGTRRLSVTGGVRNNGADPVPLRLELRYNRDGG